MPRHIKAGTHLTCEHNICMAVTKRPTKAVLYALVAQAPPPQPAFQLGTLGGTEAAVAARLPGVPASQATTRAGDPPQLRGKGRRRSKSRRPARSRSGGSPRRRRSEERGENA